MQMLFLVKLPTAAELRGIMIKIKTEQKPNTKVLNLQAEQWSIGLTPLYLYIIPLTH